MESQPAIVSPSIYRRLFLELHEAVAIVDDNAVYVDANPAAAELLGVPLDELPGKSIADFTPPGVEFTDAWQEFLRLERTQGEYPILRPDGDRRLVELSSIANVEPGYHVALMRDVTERRQLERELRKSEARFRDLFENAADMIYTIDLAGHFLTVNASMEAELGYSQRELLQMRVEDVALPSNEFAFRTAFEMKQRGELSTTYHIDLRRRDGSVMSAEVTSRIITNEQGEPAAIQGIARDVTERLEEEREVRAREERTRNVLDSMPCAVCISDGERLLHWNEALRQLTGYSDAQIGEPDFLWQLVDESYLEPAMERSRQQIAGASAPLLYRSPYTRADGEQRWSEIHSAPIDYDGESRVVIVAFDVTEGQHAEEALRASEERLRNVVEGMPAGIWIADGDNLVLVNRGLCEMTGYSREQLLEPGFFGEHVVHPEDIELVLERGRARIGGEQVPSSYEVRLIRSDGEVRSVQLQATRLDSYRGQPASLVACVDLTERRQAEEQRLALESRMQEAQKLESLGVLAGGIAHDFNNLLVGILGNADIALGDLSEQSPAYDVVENIKLAATRAAELTRQMLAYSGKGRFVVERVSLSAMVEEMAHLLDVSTSRQAQLRYDFTPELPAVEADITQLRQVVMNLITNASDALGDREGTITVRTGTTYVDAHHPVQRPLEPELAEGEYVTLEVTDTGEGMDEATRRRIFDPFFTTKFTGRGLGLAAVLGIVRGHQGAIQVESAPGEGATFRVLLPAASAARDRSQDAGARSERWHGTGRVLLIDDDETVRTVTERMVRSAGFDVDVAASGESGVATFEANAGAYAAILLDLTMPGLGGEEVFHRVRSIRPDIPVILTSGFSEQEAMARFTGTGLAGFLQKPYGLADVHAALRQATEGEGQGTP